MNETKHYYKKIDNINAYDNKYINGKSIYDDMFDESFIGCFTRSFSKSSNFLEIGSYTGRISKKLEKAGVLFDQSDIHDKPIYFGPNTKNYFKIELENYDTFKDIKHNYDYIISLGHQISFSNNIDLSIKNLASILSEKGVMMFDIWQKDSIIELPNYPIQRATKNEIHRILDENSLKIKNIYYGQSLIYHLSPYYDGLVSKFSKSLFFNKIYFFLDRYFLSKISFFNKKSQSIIFLVQRK